MIGWPVRLKCAVACLCGELSQQPTCPQIRSEIQLIDVAPAPVLARLKGPHDRVAGPLEMCSCVLVRRVVAAAHVPADHAEAQVHPPATHPQAVFAAVGAGGDFADLIDVVAFLHRGLLAYDATLASTTGARLAASMAVVAAICARIAEFTGRER